MGARKGTRSLTCREQAIFGLRWFRERGDIPKLGRDHGISQATAYRYPGRLSTMGVGGISGAPQAISTAY
jgi:hypothetical protein